MRYVPFVADVDSWKKAFSADAKTRNRARWMVNQIGHGQSEPAIKLVTPTQQAVERAQSEMEEMRENGSAPLDYKPKVGKQIMQKKKKKGSDKKSVNKRFKFKP